jgi:hypothetical protein
MKSTQFYLAQFDKSDNTATIIICVILILMIVHSLIKRSKTDEELL